MNTIKTTVGIKISNDSNDINNYINLVNKPREEHGRKPLTINIDNEQVEEIDVVYGYENIEKNTEDNTEDNVSNHTESIPLHPFDINEVRESFRNVGLAHYGNKYLPQEQKYFLKNAEVIGKGFLDVNVHGVVIQDYELAGENPVEIINTISSDNYYQNYRVGFFSEEAYPTIILIVENNDGSTNFYYKSFEENVQENLTEILDKTITEDPGEYLYENLNTIKNVIMGLETPSNSTTEMVAVNTGDDVFTTQEIRRISNTIGVSIMGIAMLVPVVSLVALKLFERIGKKKEAKNNENNVSKEKMKTGTKKTLYKDVDFLKVQIKDLEKNINEQAKLYLKTKKKNCYNELTRLNENLRLLFLYVNEKQDTIILQSLAIEYENLLSSLNRLISQDYWGDIVNNPNHYKDSRERINKVLVIIDKINKKAVRDIQKIKANDAIEYNIDIKTIENITNYNNDLDEFLNKPVYVRKPVR